MKKALLGVVMIIFTVACTEEIIVPVEVIKEVIVKPKLDPEIDVLYKALSGKWNTTNYMITRQKDVLLSERYTYGYNHPNICEVLDTLAPDGDLVKFYNLKYDTTRQHLRGLKTQTCSGAKDSVIWEVQLSYNANVYVPQLYTEHPFIIIEKDLTNKVKMVYNLIFFNLNKFPNDEFTPKNFLDVNAVYKDDILPYNNVQYEIQFNKE